MSLDRGNVSRFVDKLVAYSGDILPIGRQYEKMSYFRHFQTVLHILLQKKAHVKTSWEDNSSSRPKFNLLHQRNSPLRLVQRYGTDPGIVTRLKTWKNCLFSS